MSGKEIEYQTEDGFKLRGFLSCSEKSATAKKPAVLIASDWGGRGEYFCNKAEELAKMGYVGFALDMYGAGLVVKTKEEKRALITPLREDRSKLLARVQAAYDYISEQPMVDTNNIAIIGYCFGGMVALDLARSGTSIKGSVSFHGLLGAPDDLPVNDIKCKVLVLNGNEDILVPYQDIIDFSKEMTQKNVDWQVHNYGLIKHAFTNPRATDPNSDLKYDAIADKRSWDTTVAFFNEIFE